MATWMSSKSSTRWVSTSGGINGIGAGVEDPDTIDVPFAEPFDRWLDVEVVVLAAMRLG